MTIYISGKITGMEEEAKILFAQAEKALRAHGHVVVNPMTLPHLHDKSWNSYMKECIVALYGCDAIYMMGNWEQSKGAKSEHAIANILGIQIMLEGSFIMKDIEHVESGRYQATILDLLEVIKFSFWNNYESIPKVDFAISILRNQIEVQKELCNYSIEKNPLWNHIIEGNFYDDRYDKPYLPYLIEVIHYTICQHLGNNQIAYESYHTLDHYSKMDKKYNRYDKWVDCSQSKEWKALMEKRKQPANSNV